MPRAMTNSVKTINGLSAVGSITSCYENRIANTITVPVATSDGCQLTSQLAMYGIPPPYGGRGALGYAQGYDQQHEDQECSCCWFHH